MFHGLKFLQIQQLAFEQSKEVFDHGVIQTVSLAAHALSDTLFAKHLLILFVLVLPALVRMKNKICVIRDPCKRLIQHGGDHAQHRSGMRWSVPSARFISAGRYAPASA